MFQPFFPVKIQVTTANIEKLLTVLQNSGATIYDLETVDDLTARFSVSGYSFSNIKALLRRYTFDFVVIHNGRFKRSLKTLSQRPVLLIGGIIIFFLSVFIPTRVLFVRVNGTELLNPEVIIETAATCGIKFGASVRNVSTETAKNMLLSHFPTLKWAGIRTEGCTVIISVSERENLNQESHCNVSNIVALYDGEICNMTVVRGVAQCAVGQTVQKGQILVNGTWDLGISILKQQAQAEIYALTSRQISAIYFPPVLKSPDNKAATKSLAVLFGKNLINLKKCSGNYNTICGTLYEEKTVKLPGEFLLPISYITTSRDSTKINSIMDQPEALLRQYLQTQMIAGQIMQENIVHVQNDDTWELDGSYYCRELIGLEVEEEIALEYGQRN